MYNLISLQNVNNIDSTSGYEMIDSQSHEVHSVKLDIIISYQTNTSGIVFLLKLPPK